MCIRDRILSYIEDMPTVNYAKKQLCQTAANLERKISIPQVKAKLTLIQEVQTDDFWDSGNILLFEKVRCV